MSCRSTRSNSAAVSFAHGLSGLNDSQVQSLFHELKREARRHDAVAPSPEEFLSGIEKIEMQVRSARTLSSSLQSRILDRLRRAKSEGVPSAEDWYAVQHIASSSELSARRLDDFTARLAGAWNSDESKTRELFASWVSAHPDDFEDVIVDDPAFRYDLDPLAPKDTGTQRALRKLGYEHYLTQPHPVFVYGTLRSGQGNHRLMDGAITSLTPARLEGAAIYGAHRGFPYAKEADGAVTVGEVIWLTSNVRGLIARENLDHLEGFDSDRPTSSHYERVLRHVSYMDAEGQERTVAAWTYMARGYAASQLLESDRIDDGDWVRARRSFMTDRSAAERAWYTRNGLYESTNQ